MKIKGEHWYWNKPEQRTKHGLVTRRIADSIVESRRVWVYVHPAGSAFEGRVESIGFSVEIGFWVKIILVGDNLLFNGFVLDRTAEVDDVRQFIRRSSRER
jgi:hypothetical protein